MAGDSNLGTGNVTGNSAGTLAFTGSTTTTRSFTMNGGTVSVAAGQTVTFNGGTVNSAFLDGSGTFATSTAGATFTREHHPVGDRQLEQSADQFTHFTDGGPFNVAAGVTGPVTLNGFTIAGSGSMTIGANSSGQRRPTSSPTAC